MVWCLEKEVKQKSYENIETHDGADRYHCPFG